MSITPELPTDADMAGLLILDGMQPYSYDFSNNSFQPISNGHHFVVSPDGRWLAYSEMSEDSPTGMWLTIESVNGQQIKLPIQDSWLWTLGPRWLDNQLLVYNLANGVSSGIYSVVVVNPFTGDTQELASDYPGIRRVGDWMHFGSSTVIYHPSLDLVIYPETTEEGEFIVLWDRRTQDAIVKLQSIGFWEDQEVKPLWLPDGNRFITEASVSQGVYEWFLVSIDGEIRQLTHFGDYFHSVTIGGAQISPNGQFLAFWLDVNPSGEGYSGQNLAVMDLETLQVTNYCIPGSVQGDASSPVWSPDSRYIAVEDDYAPNVHHIVLVNPTDGWATWIVEENVFPAGWMDTP